jgi:hypothetical protein
MASTYAKACIIPVCEGEKFGLVHKFPSEKSKFQEWLQIIKENCGEINKMKNLNQDQVKTRCFVCSRHFTIEAYKNEASRSLNLTSVPQLNLKNLDQLHLSKASQPDQPAKEELPRIIIQKPPVKILNTILEIQQTQGATGQNRQIQIIKRKNSSPEKVVVKKVKHEESSFGINWQSGNSDDMVLFKDVTIEEIPVEIEAAKVEEPEPPQNKLMALFEVTPEQYKSLNERLTASERNTKVEQIITSFLDNDDENKVEAEHKNGE